MERVRGGDAVFLHLEAPETPLHTLKVLLLDTTRRGRPVTLDELHHAMEPRLGLVARATQRVRGRPLLGRPFWVGDPDFDLRWHLDERTLPSPGDRRQLDQEIAELAMAHVDPTRPLWSLTLVHGLEGGRQAVVLRVHHALMDGLAAANTFLACTTEEPGGQVPPVETGPAELVRGREMAAAVVAGVPRAVAKLTVLVRDAWQSHQRAKAFRARSPGAPPFVGAPRNFCNARGGLRRVCASGDLPFDDFRAVAKATDTTINGVLHAVIAGAMRRELERRGGDLEQPTVAVFGIAVDPDDSHRRWGNHITPTTVRMHSELADPLERLRETGRSCRDGVELRKETGVEMASRWTNFTCRAAPALQRLLAYRLPRIVNHVTTANVVGPRSTRWLGDVEVCGWISFAVAVPPSNCNVTVYSYAGSMCVGLVTMPEVLDDPHRFLDDMRASLAELVSAAGLTSAAEPARAS